MHAAVQSSGPLVDDCTDRRMTGSVIPVTRVFLRDHTKMSTSRIARLESNSQYIGMNRIVV